MKIIQESEKNKKTAYEWIKNKYNPSSSLSLHQKKEKRKIFKWESERKKVKNWNRRQKKQHKLKTADEEKESTREVKEMEGMRSHTRWMKEWERKLKTGNCLNNSVKVKYYFNELDCKERKLSLCWLHGTFLVVDKYIAYIFLHALVSERI